jgi:hypothetical protein
MRRAIMWLVAQACYWYGDMLSRLFELVPDRWERVGGWLCDRYSAALLTSLEINDKYDLHIWSEEI